MHPAHVFHPSHVSDQFFNLPGWTVEDVSYDDQAGYTILARCVDLQAVELAPPSSDPNRALAPALPLEGLRFVRNGSTKIEILDAPILNRPARIVAKQQRFVSKGHSTGLRTARQVLHGVDSELKMTHRLVHLINSRYPHRTISDIVRETEASKAVGMTS